MMKRRWLSTILVVAIVVVIGLSAYAFLPALTPIQKEKEPLFATGDWLNYTLSGSNVGGLPIAGSMNVSISNSSISGLSYFSTSLWNNSPDDPFRIFNFQIAPGDGPWVKEWRIQTAFGDKFVRTYINYRSGGFDELELTSVGAESGLVYQMIVCSPKYHYEINMSNSSSAGLLGFDQNGSIIVPIGSARVSSENHTSYTLGNWSGATGFGSLQVMGGERLRYDVTGSNVTFYIFSMNNIDSMLDGGQFEFDPLHSMQKGLQGIFDHEIQAGTYWYVVQMDPAPEERFVVYYWG